MAVINSKELRRIESKIAQIKRFEQKSLNVSGNTLLSLDSISAEREEYGDAARLRELAKFTRELSAYLNRYKKTVDACAVMLDVAAENVKARSKKGL